MQTPLVSVITPTIADRRHLLHRCALSVVEQTYPNLEHIIVCDYPDDLVEQLVPDSGLPTVTVSLGRNWHQFTGQRSWGAVPRNVGCCLARGEYIAYVDDDDELLPAHVSKLMELITRTGADYVSSRFERFFPDGSRDTIGSGQVTHGHIGTPSVLHKVECLKVATWPLAGYSEDIVLFSAWRAGGLRHAYLPEVTSHVYMR